MADDSQKRDTTSGNESQSHAKYSKKTSDSPPKQDAGEALMSRPNSTTTRLADPDKGKV